MARTTRAAVALVAVASGQTAELCSGAVTAEGMELRLASDAAAIQAFLDDEIPDIILAQPPLIDIPAILAMRAHSAPGLQDVPLVILTHRRPEDEALFPEELSPDDCIVLPCHVSELRLRLRTAIELARLRQRNRASRYALADEQQTTMLAAETAPLAKRESLVGQVVTGCRLLERLRHNGETDTYRARHLALDRDVCVKLLPRALGAWEPGRLQRFQRGARMLAQLDHTGLASVYDAGEDGKYYYLIRAFVPGTPIDALLREAGAMSTLEVVRIGIAVAGALACAHARGILHRDIKPANIILGNDGEPRLIDFGLACACGPTDISTAGEIIGTPHYMPPEQVDGEPLDERADIYALGATLYHMVTGRAPFEADSWLHVLRKQVEESPPAPDTIAPQVPAALSNAITRMMAKDRSQRFTNAPAVQEALENI